MKTLRKPAVLLAAGALALGGLTACGGGDKKDAGSSSGDPKIKLASSFKNLSANGAFSVGIHIDDKDGNLKKSFAKDSTSEEVKIFDRVLDGSIKVTANADKADPTKSSFKLELLEGSKADFALTVVAGDLYLHLDKDFLTEVGGEDAIKTLNGFAPALATGGTIKIAGLLSQLEDLGEDISGSTAKPTATPSIDPAAISKAFSDAFASAVTITSTSGSTYNVTAELKTLVNAIANTISPIVKSVGGEAASEFGDVDDLAAQVPAGTVAGTIKLDGDTVSEVTLEFQSIVDYIVKADPSSAEDAPNAKGSSLVLSFDKNASAVTAPSGATPLDFSKILGSLFGGLSGGAGAGATTPSIPCSALPAGVSIPCTK